MRDRMIPKGVEVLQIFAHLEPKRGYHMNQLWMDRETDIASKVTSSTAVSVNDMRQVAAAAASKLIAKLPDSIFLRTLGTPEVQKAPPQIGSLAQRATEEWERSICENKAFAILNKLQAGKSAIIKKDGGEMLVALVLDKPLATAKALVDDPPALVEEIMRIMKNKQSHPVIAQMVKPDVRDDLPISEFAKASSSSGGSHTQRLTQPVSSKTGFSEIQCHIGFCQRG